MRKPFYIERWKTGDSDELQTEEYLEFKTKLKDSILYSESKIVQRYMNLCMVYEDFRTVIELNKTMEDMLMGKYLFYKLDKASVRKKKRDVEDLIFEAETNNTLLMQSLFTTSIVTYAKWFTATSGGKKTKLESREMYKTASKAIKETHELVMTYRHCYFAHSGPDSLGYEKAVPLYVSGGNNPDTDFLTSLPIKKRVPSLKEVRRFQKLFITAQSYTNGEIQKIKPKVIEEFKQLIKA